MKHWVTDLTEPTLWIRGKRYQLSKAVWIRPQAASTPIFAVGAVALVNILGPTIMSNGRLYVFGPPVNEDIGWAVVTCSTDILKCRYIGGRTQWGASSYTLARFIVVEARGRKSP